MSIPEDHRKAGMENEDLLGKLLEEQALDVLWKTEEELLGFKVSIKNKPTTRRGILSILSSLFDPLCFGVSFLIRGKEILQRLCEKNLKWDTKLPKVLQNESEKWKIKLPALQRGQIKRCFTLSDFGRVSECSLHHFSDACKSGFGQASYLRLVDEKEKIHCSLVMGKSKVTPQKYISIPRPELVAATLSMKISVMLRKELQFPDLKEMFWTDSETVQEYTKIQPKRFKISVPNGAEIIKENSLVARFYVNTKENPADLSSRGINTTNGKATEMLFFGKPYLWQPERT